MTPRIADYLQAACEVTTHPVADLTSPSRFRCHVRTRQALCHLARAAGHSYPAIGRKLNRDHSSVIVAERVARALVEQDAGYRGLVERIERRAHEIVTDRAKAIGRAVERLAA